MDRLMVSGEGFPGTKEFLEHNEQSFLHPLIALAQMMGDYVLIPTAEMTTSGSEIIYGANQVRYYITYQGEVVPFFGNPPASPTATVVIKKTVTEAGYDTAGTGEFTNMLPVWRTFRASIGNPADAGVVASFAWSALKMIRNMKELDLIKSVNGSIVISNSETNGFFGIATGAINSVELLPAEGVLFPRIRVHFDSLGITDYVPIISSDSIFATNLTDVAVIEKTATSFTFMLHTMTYNSTGGGMVTQYFSSLDYNIQIIRL